ncbi:GNAT family N-acetyltransferase [Brevibacillus borstelensis]|uniref:GNAT family N-acetyltransferase n=1 Tax=Brevibacillus borstelensis TaxID=45462 RepID=UPI0030C1EEC7
MNTRYANQNDAIEIFRIDEKVIHSPSRSDYISEMITKNRCLVAEQNSTISGFLTFDTNFFGYWFVSLVIVDPSYRHKGIATALLKQIERLCPTPKLFTSTNQSNYAMHKLCDRLGFAKTGMIENLDEGDPEIIYFKQIDRPAR